MTVAPSGGPAAPPGVARTIAVRAVAALVLIPCVILVLGMALLLTPEQASLGPGGNHTAAPGQSLSGLGYLVLAAGAAMGGTFAEVMRNGGMVTLPKRQDGGLHLGTLLGALIGVVAAFITDATVGLVGASIWKAGTLGVLTGLGAKSTLDTFLAAKEMPKRAAALRDAPKAAPKKRPRTRAAP